MIIETPFIITMRILTCGTFEPLYMQTIFVMPIKDVAFNILTVVIVVFVLTDHFIFINSDHII